MEQTKLFQFTLQPKLALFSFLIQVDFQVIDRVDLCNDILNCNVEIVLDASENLLAYSLTLAWK